METIFMTNTNTEKALLPKLKNQGFIRGIYVDSDIDLNKKTKAGDTYAGGWVRVKVGESLIEVRLFQMMKTKNYKSPAREEIINPNYTGLSTFKSKYHSVVECSNKLDKLKSSGLSDEEAMQQAEQAGYTPVVIEVGGISLDVYDKPDDNGNIGDTQYRNVNGQYVRAAKDQSAEHVANFTLEAVYQSSRVETTFQDGEPLETDRTIINVLLVDDYKGIAKKTTVIAPAHDGMIAYDYLSDAFRGGEVIRLIGNLVNSKEETVEEIEVGFGQKQTKKKTKYVNEWQAVSLSAPYVEERYEIAPEALVEAQSKYLAECQVSASAKKQAPSNAGVPAPAFGVGANPAPKTDTGGGLTPEMAKSMLGF